MIFTDPVVTRGRDKTRLKVHAEQPVCSDVLGRSFGHARDASTNIARDFSRRALRSFAPDKSLR